MISKILAILAVIAILITAIVGWGYSRTLSKIVRQTELSRISDTNVLAAFDNIEELLLTFHYDSVFLRPVDFRENITAPNIIYSVEVGNGMILGGDPQNPTISNDGVLSINGLSGAMTLQSGENIQLVEENGALKITSSYVDTNTQLSKEQVLDYVLDGESVGNFTDLQIGSILLSAPGTSSLTSGASLIGVYDGNFGVLVGQDVQSVLEDIDSQLSISARTYENGLTDTGSVIKLGGQLTENTRLYDSSNEYLYFDTATGNVGIGTTGTSGKFQVGASNPFIVNSSGQVGIKNTNLSTYDLTIGSGDNGSFRIGSAVSEFGNDGYVRFETGLGRVSQNFSIKQHNDPYNVDSKLTFNVGDDESSASLESPNGKLFLGPGIPGSVNLGWESGIEMHSEFVFRDDNIGNNVLILGYSAAIDGEEESGIVGRTNFLYIKDTSDNPILSFNNYTGTSSLEGISNDGKLRIHKTLVALSNVGIGTTTPTSMLSVGASSQFQVNSSGNIVKLNNVTTSFPNSQGASNSILQNNGSGTLSWTSFASAGLVTGTGTDNYLSRWNSAGTGLENGSLVDNSTTGLSFNIDSSNNVGIGGTAANTSPRLYVGADGNVGIGTTGPDGKLYVSGTTDVNQLIVQSSVGQTNANGLIALRSFDGTTLLEVSSDDITNAYFGLNTGASNTTGTSNTFIGSTAGTLNTTGTYNTASGYRALASNTTGSYNTAIGTEALYSNTTSVSNTAIGYQSLYSNTTGTNNTALGLYALLANVTGGHNAASGIQALGSNTTGSFNTAHGKNALYSNTIGNNNTALGFNTGSNITTGSNNLIIGYNVNAPSATSSNQMNIGNIIFGTGIDGTVNTLSSGNVGIGTTSPGGKLALLGAGTTTGFTFRTQDSAGTDRFVIQDNGNVGIGTTAPNGKLEVVGNIRADQLSTFGRGIEFQSNSEYLKEISGTSYLSTWYPLIIRTTNTGAYMSFRENSSEVMRITGGNLGIGTTNPTSIFSVGASSQFQVDSSGNIVKLNNVTTSFPSSQGASNSILQNNGSGILSWTSFASAGLVTGTGTDNYLSRWNSAGTGLENGSFVDNSTTGLSFNIDSSNNVGIGGTAANTSPRLYVGADGNVGIGTTGPGSKLSVSGGLSLGSSYTGTAAPTNGVIVEGNVGIGLANPSAKLEVFVNGSDTTALRLGYYTYGLMMTPGGKLSTDTFTFNAYAGTSTNSVLNKYIFNADTWGGYPTTNGYGVAMSFKGTATAYAGREFGRIKYLWEDATDATRKSKLILSTYNVATENDALTIDSSGNVGIGTTAPGAKLHIPSDASNTAELIIGDNVNVLPSNQGYTLATIMDADNVPGLLVGKDATHNLLFNWTGSASTGYGVLETYGGTNSLVLQSSGGNVGIGTTGPGSILNVVADTPELRIQTSNTTFASGLGVSFKASGTSGRAMAIYTYFDGGSPNSPDRMGVLAYSGSELLTIKNSGNVGIGTTAPVTALDVQQSGTYHQFRLSNNANSQKLWAGSVADTIGSYIGNNAYYNNNFQFTPNYTAASGINFRQDGSTELWNDTGLTSGVLYTPSKSMVITNTGNVGIGTTNPGWKLDVAAGYINSVSGYKTNGADYAEYFETKD
nr:hypothetical protein [Candidatus Woesebacteria bacterium]